MTTTEPPDAGAVATGLRAVLAAVEAGEVEARPEERAYLAGAADAMERLAKSTTGNPLRNTTV